MAALASLASVIIALLLPELGAASRTRRRLCIATLIGALQGSSMSRPKIPSFIVTLAGLGMWSGIALAIAKTTVPVAQSDSEAVDWLDAQTWACRMRSRSRC